MKTDKKKTDEMRAEYDFSQAKRGQFYCPLDKDYKVRVHQSNGTTVVNQYTLTEVPAANFASCL